MGMNEELAVLGKEIETAKKQVATLEGRKEEILDRLEKDFDCVTIEEAEDLLATLNKELATAEENIQKDFVALKEKFSW